MDLQRALLHTDVKGTRDLRLTASPRRACGLINPWGKRDHCQVSVLEARSPLIRCVSSLKTATVSYIYLFAHFVRNLGGNKVKFGQEHRKTQILTVVSYQYPEGNEQCKWELVNLHLNAENSAKLCWATWTNFFTWTTKRMQEIWGPALPMWSSTIKIPCLGLTTKRKGWSTPLLPEPEDFNQGLEL